MTNYEIDWKFFSQLNDAISKSIDCWINNGLFLWLLNSIQLEFYFLSLRHGFNSTCFGEIELLHPLVLPPLMAVGSELADR